jgi:diacylglycerol kinase (ATP)
MNRPAGQPSASSPSDQQQESAGGRSARRAGQFAQGPQAPPAGSTAASGPGAITQSFSQHSEIFNVSGNNNLLNLANIDSTFFTQQQQLRAEQQQQRQQQQQYNYAGHHHHQQQQQQQQQQQAQQQAQPTRPSGSPSSTASNECLTSERTSTSTSGSTASSSSGSQQMAPGGGGVAATAAAASRPQPLARNLAQHQQQLDNEVSLHQQQQQQSAMMRASAFAGQPADAADQLSKSDTTDDIQSLTSQFNLSLAGSTYQFQQSIQQQQQQQQNPGTLQQAASGADHQAQQPDASGPGVSKSAGSSTTGAGATTEHGHYFTKKTFSKFTYCHHCADMLWGLIGQGYICEVCNFVVHERCMKMVVSCCSTVASSAIKCPMPHCWVDAHPKRKFCNVCRKKIEDNASAIRCSVCEYCVHIECQEFSISDCRECATYVPDQSLEDVVQQHHWREGNLPQNSKCHWCKKSCFSAECLTGMRCEWCQITVHTSCLKHVPRECNLGCLLSIMLPPCSVSIPRTDVPMETIICVQNRYNYNPSSAGGYAGAGQLLAGAGATGVAASAGPNDLVMISSGSQLSSAAIAAKRDNLSPRSASEDSSQMALHYQQQEDFLSRDNEELLRVYDGNSSMKKRSFRLISVHKSATREALIAACLRAFYVHDDVTHYVLYDLQDGEREIDEQFPLANLISKRDRSQSRPPPAVLLRYRPPDSFMGSIKVYPGRLNVSDLTYCKVTVTSDTSVDDVMREALEKFKLSTRDLNRYRLVEVSLDKGSSVHERTMDNQECPWEIIKNVARESVRQKENTRFYLQQQDEVYCSSVAIFVGNLPTNLSQKQYESMLMEHLGKPYRFKQINPIYYEYGSCIITYDNADIAVKAFYMLRESTIRTGDEQRNLVVLLLPNIVPSMIPDGVRPLLVFVNVKSGGCQGLELITSFRRLLNPYQVYDLENGGPLPGLYVFRKIRDYKILVSGGDGSVGWVLQCLDNVGQDSECQSPPCAIIPLGTGNDLARVLRWGSGYTGAEDPINFLKDIIDAEEVILDRWTVVFHSDEASKQDYPSSLSVTPGTGSGAEDNAAIFVMNNYLGIGLDADLCLGFHNAREENPDKFNSRLHNKGVYVKQAIRKIVNKNSWTNLNKAIKLEVDGKPVPLPHIEGIIILNILSWGSGANPWGPEIEDRFAKPTHYDGMLEVVGVTGIVHMGQIQSGLSRAIRIAQGGRVSTLPIERCLLFLRYSRKTIQTNTLPLPPLPIRATDQNST